ncbi:MAG: Cys-tRNA(Pro) deacylase [bacterium]|nr:Cys-tRNA(Pro) deacylase [bacterium]
MAKKDEKTNVCRVFDSKKAVYQFRRFETDVTNGVEIANLLGQNPDRVFKTLVTVGKTKQHYVFVIPVNKELDLKKAAKTVGEKSIEMIPQKELLPLTGYVHGGCSPVGMKKSFPTVIHESATDFETIFFSAGKIGCQIETALAELAKLIRYETADVIVESLQS